MNKEETQLIRDDVRLGKGARIMGFVNLYGCEIGKGTLVGTFVEIQEKVRVGERCKIQSHSFICSGVTIEEEVFIGHGVMFINDKHPRATNEEGKLETAVDWENRFQPTLVKRRASIGSGATIMGGIVVGEGAIIGAGAVVLADVPDGATVVGDPARILKKEK